MCPRKLCDSNCEARQDSDDGDVDGMNDSVVSEDFNFADGRIQMEDMGAAMCACVRAGGHMCV